MTFDVITTFSCTLFKCLGYAITISLRCADPGIFVRGGEGWGVEARLPKNNRNNVFLNPQLILQLYMGVQHFSGGGGSNISRGGGGGPDAYFHKNAYNL